MEAIVWLVFIAIWFISGVVKSIKQVSDQRPGQQPGPTQEQPQPQRPQPARQRPQPARQPDGEDPMIRLLRQLSGETEVQPEQTPRESPRQPSYQPPTPRKQAPPPTPRLIAQADRSRPVQARDVSVAKTPPVPRVALPPRAKIASPLVSHSHGASAMARSLSRDLRNPGSVRKAILLQEILGKPLGLQGLPK